MSEEPKALVYVKKNVQDNESMLNFNRNEESPQELPLDVAHRLVAAGVAEPAEEQPEEPQPQAQRAQSRPSGPQVQPKPAPQQ